MSTTPTSDAPARARTILIIILLALIALVLLGRCSHHDTHQPAGTATINGTTTGQATNDSDSSQPSTNPSSIGSVVTNSDVQQVGVDWVTAFHHLDTSKPCPGWDRSNYLNDQGQLIVAGDLLTRLNMMLRNAPANCSSGSDADYWRQAVSHHLVQDVNISGQVTVVNEGPNTWHVEVPWQLTTATDGGVPIPGNQQFTVVTVQQQQGRYVAVSDAMPQGR